MELKDKKVLVVGFARTGQAVCDFLLERGALVTVTDKKPLDQLENVANYQEKGVLFDCGGHRMEACLEADLIVLSPGVPPLP